MTYPRPLLVVLLLSIAAGCGNAARSTGNPNPPPNEEPDSGQPPDNTPPPKLDAMPPSGAANGQKCTSRTQCESGFCVDGVCCDDSCTGTCRACDVAGSMGQCTNVPDNEDPDNECGTDMVNTCKRDGMCDGQGACRKYAAGTECAPASCTGSVESSNRTCDGNGTCAAATTKQCTQGCTNGVCPAPCGAANPCQQGLYCDPTAVCRPKKAMGMTCTTADECSLGFCVDGVCCGSACTGTCQACNLPGSVGNCTPVPANQDPNNECPADINAPCGRAGGCDGVGACRLQPDGTPCGGGMTCSGTTESLRACNGRGTCATVNPRSCAPYRCQGTACGVTCFSNADCAPGSTCQGGACQTGGVVMGGELLHWAFDEASNTTTIAEDTSGNFHQGEYTGNAGNRPTVSNNVPSVGAPNPHSRTFDNAQRESVRLAAFPQDLRPNNDLTLSAWFRATTVDTSGADIISGGDTYFLRLRTGSIEFGKRIANPNGGASVFVGCRVNQTGHLNNQWHHLAGVTTPAGMILYLDGNEICSNTRGEDIVYDRGNDLWVGRHGFNETVWDFEGSIDDVRIFGRGLDPDEIRGIAGANPGAADIVLNWRFDEGSNTTTNANDDSGNNYDGTYIGNNGNLPAPSPDVAPIAGVNNPFSRLFDRAQRKAVQRTNMPTALKPQNDLSISVWYKATDTDTSGSELVSAGDNYSVRLRPNLIEFSKRINDGTARFVQCPGPVNNHLNNQWHHIAAVTSIDGMVVYFDGVEVCNNSQGSNIVYDQGNTFFVGRHGNGQTNWDFGGRIDDVRVYGRALQANEVQDLFGGTRPNEVVLQWRMDEISNTTLTALDSSGSNFNGTYTGTVGHPLTSNDVPPGLIGASRVFTRASRHAVQLTNMPPALKLTNEVSVTAWYKASTLGLGTQQGEEVVSAGNSVILRVRNNEIEYTKRTAGGFVQLRAPVNGTLDGAWHHLAGVTTATGMLLYVDGNQVLTNARAENIVYDATAIFAVGRHPTQTTFDFDGNIDDVRVYARALSDAEVQAISQGQQ
ncbi:MAG TPA: LamG domain-containing protein [Polyangia bacterium]|nr:LamG domain-containing protein [Polyangia bacterium]